MNSGSSDLMSYCSWAKKNSGYRESIGEWTVIYFVSLLYKVESIWCLTLLLEMLLVMPTIGIWHLVFNSPVGDALSHANNWNLVFVLFFLFNVLWLCKEMLNHILKKCLRDMILLFHSHPNLHIKKRRVKLIHF